MLDFVSINDFKDRYQDKKIFSALCAIFFSDTIYNFSERTLKDRFIFWPDGLSAKLVDPNLKKIPGRHMLTELISLCKHDNKKITFAGSEINFDDVIFQDLNYNFIELPFDNSENLATEILNNNIGDILVLCVSSPKQESIAEIISKKKQVPIYCFGAAIYMLTGNEVIAPKFIELLGLEGLWRIFTTDTFRRLGHLARMPNGFKIYRRFLE